MQLCDWNTILNFGKYKGETVRHIYEQGDSSYLLWCLKKHDNVCFTDAVFEEIKTKGIASQDLISAVLCENGKNAEIISERDVLLLENINLRKRLRTV